MPSYLNVFIMNQINNWPSSESFPTASRLKCKIHPPYDLNWISNQGKCWWERGLTRYPKQLLSPENSSVEYIVWAHEKNRQERKFDTQTVFMFDAKVTYSTTKWSNCKKKKGTSQAGIHPNKSSCPSRNITDMTNHVGNCFTNQPKLQHD